MGNGKLKKRKKNGENTMKKDDRILQYEQNIMLFIERYVDKNEINWYENENKVLGLIAHSLGIPKNLFIAIVAVLSPMNGWKKSDSYFANIESAIGIVKTALCQEHDARMSGTDTNKQKALTMLKFWLDNGDIAENEYYGVSGMLKGPKVENFYHNLAYPHSSQKITVDVWMERIASRLHGGKTNQRTSDFDAILQAYQNVVANLQCIPHKLQAALWVKIKHEDISREWCVDDIGKFAQCGV